eukprot:gene16849-19203_t
MGPMGTMGASWAVSVRDMGTVGAQQPELAPSTVFVQPGTIRLRNQLSFEKKILSLGGEDAINVCNNDFRNINVSYEGIDMNGDRDEFLSQFGPMIIEEVRSQACDRIAEIGRKNEKYISGKVTATNREADPAPWHQMNNRSDYSFVNLICTSSVNVFPKLDHGFTKELLCVRLSSNSGDLSRVNYVLAIGSRQRSERDSGLDGVVRYEVKMLAHDHKFLLDSVRSCNRRDAVLDALQNITWHHLTGLIPASRMYKATDAGAPFFFTKQILLQQPEMWPLPTTDDGIDGLNTTQLKVVQSIGQTELGGMHHLIGPPGTGKTTTITQLLLERMCHFPEEKILLAAPSNKAIQVVLHKLVEKNTEDYAIAIIGTGKCASPEHNQYYAAEFFTPMIDDLKALRKNSRNWRSRMEELESILDHVCNRLQHVTDPSRKGLQVSDVTNQNIRMEICEFSSYSLSAVRCAESLKRCISDLIDKMYGAAEYVEKYILERAQVIFSTLVASGRKNFYKIVKRFHTVIVDEAAQALMAETFIPFMFKPARYLLVGDPKQLPATISSKHLKPIGYADSLMYVMQKVMGDSTCAQMLTTQYRMHPSISKPISDLFYDGLLVNDDSVVNRSCLLQKHLPAHMLLHGVSCAFIDLDSAERRYDEGSICNPEEAALVVKVVLFLLDHKVEPHQIGVITGYTQQATLLKKKLHEARPSLHGLTVSTIDGFQGGEKDFMLFSCVRTSESVGFMKDERRVNVALSRGRYANWVFGQARTWRMSNSPLQRFINWIEDGNRNCLSTRAVVVEASALLDSMREPPSSVSPPALSSPVRSSDPAASAEMSTLAVAAASTLIPVGLQHSLPAPPLAAPSAPSAMAESTSSSPAPVAVRSAVQREGFAAEAPQGAWARGTPMGTSTGSSATRARQRGPPAAGDIASTVATSPALPPSTAPSAAVSAAVAQTSAPPTAPVESVAPAPPVEQPAATRKQSKQNRGKVLVGAALSTGRRK